MPRPHPLAPCLRRITPRVALATLALALSALPFACGDADDAQHDVAAWALRDALGVAPSWALDLDPERRDRLRDRLRAEAAAQAEASAFADLPAPAPDAGAASAAPVEDVRALVVALDDTLALHARPPLLIQWGAQEPDGSAGAWACPVLPEDLQDTLSAEDPDDAPAPYRWTLDTRFNQPLDPGRPDGLTEAALLDAHLPRLARWLMRCDAAAGDDLSPPARRHEPVRVARAPGAPALVSWWPQTRTLALNPLALALWSAPAPPAPVALQRRPQALDTQTYADCVAATARLCRTCTETPEAVAAATCDADLLPIAPSPARDHCLPVLADPEGPELVCLNRLLYDRPSSLYACVLDRAPGCFVGSSPDTVGGLSDAYSAFLNDPACMSAFNACLGDPDPPAAPPARPFVNDDPTPSYTSEDPSCFADGCNTLCLASSTSDGASSGDPICDDSDGSGCDGCEGDSVNSGGGESCGDVCGGCEGDTL